MKLKDQEKETVRRLKLKWIDIVRNQLTKLNITWEEAKELS